MKVTCEWIHKLRFTADAGGFKIPMDGSLPFGEESAPSPKEVLLSALCACTGMDVIALLNKYKQLPEDFRIEAQAKVEPNHPNELVNFQLNYIVSGQCDSDKLLNAIYLSQSKYCAISSMISRGTDINYNVFLNDKLLSTGEADFHLIAHQYQHNHAQEFDS